MPTMMFGGIEPVPGDRRAREVDSAPVAMIAVVALQDLRGREGQTGGTARNARKNEL